MMLHLYFARRFLFSFSTVFAVFFLLMALFDMLEQIRRFDAADVGFGRIVALTLLKVPSSLYEILPLIVIIATLSLFLALARSSELVVTRAAGRSALRTLNAPLLVALAIGGLAVAGLNPIVAATSKQYETLSTALLGTPASVLEISREGLWLRQGDAAGQVVIRATRATLNGAELIGATFLGFAPDGLPSFRLEADRARLTNGAWDLTGVKEWQLANSDNPERDALLHDDYRLATTLTPDQIIDSFGTPSAIPIWELPAFIARLEAAGFSARQHRVWFHMELALPLMLTSMVLIGAGFTMRHTRFGRTGLMVVLALGLGFSLFFIRNFAQILAENGQIPILLAAWGPPVAAVLLPLGLLLHLEDG